MVYLLVRRIQMVTFARKNVACTHVGRKASKVCTCIIRSKNMLIQRFQNVPPSSCCGLSSYERKSLIKCMHLPNLFSRTNGGMPHVSILSILRLRLITVEIVEAPDALELAKLTAWVTQYLLMSSFVNPASNMQNWYTGFFRIDSNDRFVVALIVFLYLVLCRMNQIEYVSSTTDWSYNPCGRYLPSDSSSLVQWQSRWFFSIIHRHYSSGEKFIGYVQNFFSKVPGYNINCSLADLLSICFKYDSRLYVCNAVSALPKTMPLFRVAATVYNWHYLVYKLFNFSRSGTRHCPFFHWYSALQTLHSRVFNHHIGLVPMVAHFNFPFFVFILNVDD